MCSDPFPTVSISSTRLCELGEMRGCSPDKSSPSCDLLLVDSTAEYSSDLAKMSDFPLYAVAEGKGGGTPAVGVVEKRFMAEPFFFSSWKAALKLRAAAAVLKLPALEL